MRTRFGFLGPTDVRLGTPIFNPVAGSYPGTGDFSVTVSVVAPATNFRYTINNANIGLNQGTLVNATSGVVTVPDGAVLRAIAIDPSHNVSLVATGTYNHTLVMPRGIVSFAGANGQTIDPLVLSSRPQVSIVAVVTPWYQFEPLEGQYDFSFLDSEVARAVAAGKKIMIAIGTGSDNESAGGSKPDWLYALGIPVFSFVDTQEGTVTIPAFFNQTFLDKKKAMVAALGAHFGSNPNVAITAGGFGNGNTEDWAMPSGNQVDGLPPAGSTMDSRWLALGYTHAKMVEAGRQTIDAYMNAFPGAHLRMPIGKVKSPVLEPTGQYSLAQEVISNAHATWGNRFILSYNAMKSISGVPAFNLGNPPLSGQVAGHCSADPTFRMLGGSNPNGYTDDEAFRMAFDIAIADGLEFYEVTEKDVIDLTAALTYGHDLFFP